MKEKLTGHALLWCSDLGAWDINSRRNSKVTEKVLAKRSLHFMACIDVDVGTGQSRDVQLGQ